MGFWASGPSAASPSAEAAAKIDGDGTTPPAPSRSERSKCWDARDTYFQCLEKHEIVDGIKEAAKAETECAVEGRGFEANCARSWVQYFKKRRVMEYQKAQTLQKLAAEGAQGLPPGAGPIPPSGSR